MGGNNFYKLVGHMYKNPLPITSLWGRGGQINIINLKTYNMGFITITIDRTKVDIATSKAKTVGSLLAFGTKTVASAAWAVSKATVKEIKSELNK